MNGNGEQLAFESALGRKSSNSMDIREFDAGLDLHAH
jgi:hypothetical protein